MGNANGLVSRIRYQRQCQPVECNQKRYFRRDQFALRGSLPGPSLVMFARDVSERHFPGFYAAFLS